MKLMTNICGNILCKVNNHNFHFSQHLQVLDCQIVEIYQFLCYGKLLTTVTCLSSNLKRLIFVEKSHTEVLEGQCSKANYAVGHMRP